MTIRGRWEGSALRWLTGLSPTAFADRCWGRSWHLASAEDRAGGPTAAVDEVFSLAAAEELISRRGLRTPFLRMIRDGVTLPNSRFTAGGGVGASIDDQVHDARVRELFREGATVVLQGLHRTWAPLTEFTHALAAELGHPVQANCYVTPAKSQGFAAHYDVHDVFVLQVHGRKQWLVHASVRPHPLRNEPWGDLAEEVGRAAAAEPLLEVTLEPGDCLYLPRGFIHSARALGGVAAHLTLGVHTWTGQHLAGVLTEKALTQLAADESVRASLPMGQAWTALDTERVRERLIAALEEIPEGAVAAAMAEKARRSMRPEAVEVFGGTTLEGAGRE